MGLRRRLEGLGALATSDNMRVLAAYSTGLVDMLPKQWALGGGWVCTRRWAEDAGRCTPALVAYSTGLGGIMLPRQWVLGGGWGRQLGGWGCLWGLLRTTSAARQA